MEPIASGCLVLILSVHRDLGCSFSWLGNQSMCLSHPWSLLGCVASAPCSHMRRGSPWWPRLVSPSTSPPRSPLRALVCKCTTACTTSPTVSTMEVVGGGVGGATEGAVMLLCCPQMCTFMRLDHSEGAVCMCVHARVCTYRGRQFHVSLCVCVLPGCGFAWAMITGTGAAVWITDHVCVRT